MNSLCKAVAALALGCFMSQMGGCAPSRLVSIWHDPTFQSPPLGKMLVIAVRKDASKRRIWEDAFAGQLVRRGVAATPSYTLFPEMLPDTTKIMEVVQAKGFDGILVILRLPNETNPQYVPGYTSMEQSVHYSPYWERYLTYYREVDHPGYIDSQTVGVRAIDVATTGKNGHIIWSATSRTPDPRSVTDLQSGIADMVASALAKQGIIRSSR